MEKIVKSPKFSFKFWEVWEFIKGRKKMAITIIATILGYFLTDSGVAAIVAGGSVEMLWSVLEFYAKEHRYEID